MLYADELLQEHPAKVCKDEVIGFHRSPGMPRASPPPLSHNWVALGAVGGGGGGGRSLHHFPSPQPHATQCYCKATAPWGDGSNTALWPPCPCPETPVCPRHAWASEKGVESLSEKKRFEQREREQHVLCTRSVLELQRDRGALQVDLSVFTEKCIMGNDLVLTWFPWVLRVTWPCWRGLGNICSASLLHHYT